MIRVKRINVFWFLFPIVLYASNLFNPIYIVWFFVPYIFTGLRTLISNAFKVSKKLVVLFVYISSIIITSLISNEHLHLVQAITVGFYLYFNFYYLRRREELYSFIKINIYSLLFISIYITILYSLYGDISSLGGFRGISKFDIVLRYAHTSVDAPFILVITSSLIFFSDNLKGIVKTILLVTILYLLLVYNRRTLTITYLLLIILYVLDIYKLRKLYKYYVLVPFFALFILGLVISFLPVINDYINFKAILMRVQDLNASNNRLLAWQSALRAYKNIGLSDMFKFGGDIPFLETINDKLFTHLHNGVFQLIYERGIYGLATFLILIVVTLKNLSKDLVIKGKYFIIPFLFIVIMFHSATESSYRSLHIDHYVFILVAFSALRITSFYPVNNEC